jgi:predicted RNA methylase
MDILVYLSIPILIILFIALSWLWPPDSPWSPRWRTKRKIARAAFKMVKLSKKDTVYELGSGEATALIVASQDFGAKGIGIEIEPFRFLLSKISIMRKDLSSEIKLIRGNFFEEDLSGATVVYVYLVPKTLNRLIPKFKKELKKGTPIISYKYEMKLPLIKEDKINELRLYKI